MRGGNSGLGRVAAVAIAALVFTGCPTTEDAGQEDAGRPPNDGKKAVEARSGEAEVVEGRIDALHVRGRNVYGLRRGSDVQRLARPVHSPLAASLSPAAVLDPRRGRFLAYNAWERGGPVLHIFDSIKNKDVAVAPGAYSLAWRQDGALAYFAGLQPRVRDLSTHGGHILVRSSRRAEPTRWTGKAGPYVVAAWAGKSLIVYRRAGESTDVVVFDRPRRPRVLARKASLVALSPDGQRAFLSQNNGRVPVASIVDISSGRLVDELALRAVRDPVTHAQVSYVAYSGSWERDLVVAAVSNGLAAFRVDRDKIVLDQLIGLHPDVFPTGATEPRLMASDGSIIASVEQIDAPNAALNRMALIECDRIRLICKVGAGSSYSRPPRIVYDPSRPQSQ